MKKLLATIMVISLLTSFMFVFAETSSVLGWESATNGNPGETEVKAGANNELLVSCIGRQGLTPFVVCKTKLKLDGFQVKFKVTEQLGGWVSLSFRQKIDTTTFIPGTADYGDGMFIIYTDQGGIFSNGVFKSKDVQSGAGKYSVTQFALGDVVTLDIRKDAKVGYIMSLNQIDVLWWDGAAEADLDLKYLDEYFTDGQFYFTIGALSSGKASAFEILEINGVPANSANIPSVKAVSTTSSAATSSAAVSSTATSSAASSSKATETKGGCGNKAK